jgi:AcrR family transcriptional regulator
MASVSPAEQRRLRHRADARRVILDATEAIMVEDGYDGFSMRRLVARCGYTAPTIYHHFGDKLGLIDALLEERLARLARLLRRAPVGPDPLENLRTLCRVFVRWGLRHPDHYRVLMSPRDADLAPPRGAEEVQQLLEAPLVELAAAGRLALPDVEAAGQVLWAVVHGIISLRTNRPDYKWVRGFEDLTLDALIAGLAPAEIRR